MHIINTTEPSLVDDYNDEFLDKVSDILQSRRLILGKYTKQLEDDFSKIYTSKNGILLNSATSSLILLLKYLNRDCGNVIIPSLNFIAVANSVQFSGGGIRFCDVVKDEIFPSLSEIKDAEDKDTVGIVLVDIAGERNPYIWDILAYAKNKGYFVILDSSHSTGLLSHQDILYSEIDAQVISLYPTKIITSATGGIVLTNDEAMADYLYSARHHGANVDGGLNNCEVLGGGFYSSEFDAALGVVMIKHLPDIINRRAEIAKKYDSVMLERSKIYAITTNKSVYYKYQVLCDSAVLCEKVKLQLNKKGINVGAVYNPPIHQQPLYKNIKGYCLNNTNDISTRIIAIPMHNGMTDNEVVDVVEAISKIKVA